MAIFLVRHGEAVAELVEPTQPLGPRGREEVGRMGSHLARVGVRVAEIRHSTKLRARQTAEILAERLRPPGGLREVDWLSPMADPGMAEDQVTAAVEPLMLVGHLPHLARLASLLLAGDPSRRVVQIPNAGTICLEKTDGTWALLWALAPALLPPPNEPPGPRSDPAA